MPFALVTIGLLMVVTGVKNTYADFGAQLKSDFTGPGNFTYWMLAIGAIGAMGYSTTLRPFANAFAALVILALFLSNRGFFAKLQSAIAAGPTATAARPAPTAPVVGTTQTPEVVQNQNTSSTSGDFNVADIAKFAAFVV